MSHFAAQKNIFEMPKTWKAIIRDQKRHLQLMEPHCNYQKVVGTYIRLGGGDAMRRSRGVGLTPGCAVLRPLVVVHAFVPLRGVKFGAVNSLDVFPERRRVGVPLRAARSSAGVRFL